MYTGNILGGSKSNNIANALEKAILANEYRQGELLPSQKELAEQFNASSRSLREAFKALEAKGLIEVSQGKRAVVKSNNLDRFVESLSLTMFSQANQDTRLLSDLLEVHITLEVSAARELSRRPERLTTVKYLESIVSRMEQLLISEDRENAMKQFTQLDFNFHFSIVNSNTNIVFKSIYNNLSPQLNSIFERLTDSEEDLRKKLREYHYLIDALKEGQTDLVVALTLVQTNNIKHQFDSAYLVKQ